MGLHRSLLVASTAAERGWRVNQNAIALALAQVMPAAVASGLFVSTMSVSEPAPSSGAISGVYTPVTGLQSIQCMDAPEEFSQSSAFSAMEIKRQQETESIARRHVLLDRYYSELSPDTNWGDIGWRATLTNTASGESAVYDIEGAEADSQATQTRLCLRKVTT